MRDRNERLKALRERRKIKKNLESEGILTAWCPSRGVTILLSPQENRQYQEVGYLTKNNEEVWWMDWEDKDGQQN